MSNRETGLRHFRDLVSTETEQLRSIEYRVDAVPGHPLRGLERSSRQALITQLQHQLRFELPQHCRYAFQDVAVTWWKGPNMVVHIAAVGSPTPIGLPRNCARLHHRW